MHALIAIYESMLQVDFRSLWKLKVAARIFLYGGTDNELCSQMHYEQKWNSRDCSTNSVLIHSLTNLVMWSLIFETLSHINVTVGSWNFYLLFLE